MIPSDMISSACLTSGYILIVSNTVIDRFGVRPQDLPHPDVSFRDFRDQISALNDKEPLVWSSDTKAPAKWIDMAKLTAKYGPVGGVMEAPRQPAAAAVHTPQWANPPTSYPSMPNTAASQATYAPNAQAPYNPAQYAPAYAAPHNPPQYAPPPVNVAPHNPPQYTPPPVNAAQPQYAPVNPSYVAPPSFSSAPCPVNAALVQPMASLNVAPSYPTSGSQGSAVPGSAPAPVADYSMMAGPGGSKAKGGMLSRLRGSK